MKGLNSKNSYFLGFIFVTIFCFATFFCLYYSINPLFVTMDYIWNYAFSAKIHAGLLPYRDFNLLQTPLSFYITAFFLTLLGNYFISYAIAGAFFICLMFFLFYKVTLSICQNKQIAVNSLLFTVIYTISSLALYNYNTLSIILILFIILIEFKNRVSIANNIVIGILLALLFLTKQNIFFVIAFVSGLNIIISSAFIATKLKILFIRALASISVICIYLLYLYFNNALYHFIDYTVLGLLDFSAKNKFVASYTLYFYCIIPVIIIVRSFILIIKQKRFGLDDKLFIAFCYAVGGLSMIYPMFDLNHLTMGFVLIFLLVPSVFSSSEWLASSLAKTMFIVCFASLLVANLIKIKSETFVFYSDSDRYQYTITTQLNIDQLNETISYIEQNRQQGINIVILDSRAMAYFSAMSIYDNPYDMLVQGNLGYRGEEKVLAEVKQLDQQTLFLIGDTNRMQELETVKMYVMCRYDNLGKVASFFIYKRPDYVDHNKKCDFELVEIK